MQNYKWIISTFAVSLTGCCRDEGPSCGPQVRTRTSKNQTESANAQIKINERNSRQSENAARWLADVVGAALIRSWEAGRLWRWRAWLALWPSAPENRGDQKESDEFDVHLHTSDNGVFTPPCRCEYRVWVAPCWSCCGRRINCP